MLKFYDYLLSFLKPLIVILGKIGLPKRKITGKDYFEIRDSIEIGTVFLTKTNYEFTNLINPTGLKHGAIYIGSINNSKIKYVAEAVGKGVVFTDLVSFLTTFGVENSGYASISGIKFWVYLATPLVILNSSIYPV